MALGSRNDPTCRPDSPVEAASLEFLDIETTGLRPDRGARICELALIGRNDIVLHRGADQSPIPDPVLVSHLEDLFNQFYGHVVVGHHLPFDLQFLAREADRLGQSGPTLRFIDTLTWAKRISPDGPGYRLSELVERRDLEFRGSFHTALGDARATRALFQTLVDTSGAQTLGEAGLKRISWSSF